MNYVQLNSPLGLRTFYIISDDVKLWIKWVDVWRTFVCKFLFHPRQTVDCEKQWTGAAAADGELAFIHWLFQGGAPERVKPLGQFRNLKLDLLARTVICLLSWFFFALLCWSEQSFARHLPHKYEIDFQLFKWNKYLQLKCIFYLKERKKKKKPILMNIRCSWKEEDEQFKQAWDSLGLGLVTLVSVNDALAASLLADATVDLVPSGCCLEVQWLSDPANTSECQIRQGSAGAAALESSRPPPTPSEGRRFFLGTDCDLHLHAAAAAVRWHYSLVEQPKNTHTHLSWVCRTLYCIPGNQRQDSDLKREEKEEYCMLYWKWSTFTM